MAKFKVGDVFKYIKQPQIRSDYFQNARFRVTGIGESHYLYVTTHNAFSEVRSDNENMGRISDIDHMFEIYTPPPEPRVIESYHYVWAGDGKPYLGGGLIKRDLTYEKMTDCLASIRLTITDKRDGSPFEVSAVLVHTKP